MSQDGDAAVMGPNLQGSTTLHGNMSGMRDEQRVKKRSSRVRMEHKHIPLTVAIRQHVATVHGTVSYSADHRHTMFQTHSNQQLVGKYARDKYNITIMYKRGL